MATVVGMTKAAIEQYVQQQIGILAPADHAHNDQVNEMIVPGHGISKQYSEASGKLTLKAYIGTPVIVSETQPEEKDVFWIDPSDQENYDRKIFGVGSPLGVVSAPPGWEYVDEAGTNGAWRWRKRSGTGNTGWVCVEGDTGWRDISSSLVNGWTGMILVRRTPTDVYAAIEGLSAASATDLTAFVFPEGMCPDNPRALLRDIIYTAEVTIRRVWITNARAFQVVGYASSNIFYSTIQGPTDHPWPTVLPGTAA